MDRVPKYERIFQHLRRRVNAAQPGDRLPTIRGLMEEYEASQASVVRGLDELARQGLIDRKRGSGIYVAGRPVKSKLLGVCLDGEVTSLTNIRFIEGVRSAASRHGFSVADFGQDSSFEEQVDILRNIGDSGFSGLVTSFGTTNLLRLRTLGWYGLFQEISIPIVSCRPLPAVPADVVMADFFSAFEEVGCHLRKSGVPRVTFMGSANYSSLARFQGLRAGLREEVELEIEATELSATGTYKRVGRLVEDGWRGNLVIGVPPTREADLNCLVKGPWGLRSKLSLTVPLDDSLILPPGVKAHIVFKSNYELGQIASEMLIGRVKGDRGPPRYEVLKNTVVFADEKMRKRASR